MPLLPKKRHRAFRVSLAVVMGALVILEFVTPRTPLQVLRGSILSENEKHVVDDTFHQWNVTVDDYLETSVGAKTTASPIGLDINVTNVTAAVTSRHDNDKIEHATHVAGNQGTVITGNTSNGGLYSNNMTSGDANLVEAPLVRTSAANGTTSTLSVHESATLNTIDSMARNKTVFPVHNRTRIGAKRTRQRNAIMMNKYNTSAAFIHLGKTGGSTLSLQLRNGCHSFVKKPCHKVQNETIVSELVTNYYHSEFAG